MHGDKAKLENKFYFSQTLDEKIISYSQNLPNFNAFVFKAFISIAKEELATNGEYLFYKPSDKLFGRICWKCVLAKVTP